MKLTGNATLNGTAEQVWAALNDPAVLVRTIPGCEQLETVGADTYRMTVTAGVASIKGTYLGDVQLADPQPPGAFTLKASGSGAPGTLSADVKVTLDDRGDGTTLLRYDADAVIGGPVGGVGQRVLTGVAKKTAGQFFDAVDEVLVERLTGEVRTPQAAGAAPAPAPGAGAATGDGPPTGEPLTAPAGPGAVFTRPPSPSRRGPGRAGAGAGANTHVDVHNQLAGAVVGAAIALVSVWLGWRLGRRR